MVLKNVTKNTKYLFYMSVLRFKKKRLSPLLLRYFVAYPCISCNINQYCWHTVKNYFRREEVEKVSSKHVWDYAVERPKYLFSRNRQHKENNEAEHNQVQQKYWHSKENELSIQIWTSISMYPIKTVSKREIELESYWITSGEIFLDNNFHIRQIVYELRAYATDFQLV